MVGFLNVRVAVCLVAVAVGPGLSAVFAAAPEDPYMKTGIRFVDVSFAGTLARAQQGDANAQYDLGVMYGYGKGVPQDYAAAVSWYRKAAEQQDVDAQFNLGLMYYNGTGVAQDYAAAVSWYRKAAEQGHSGAQNNLGVMYDRGTGVPQDYVQAHKWYNLAGAGVGASDKMDEIRDFATKNRDIVAAKMQPAQIAEAQRLASAWRKK